MSFCSAFVFGACIHVAVKQEEENKIQLKCFFRFLFLQEKKILLDKVYIAQRKRKEMLKCSHNNDKGTAVAA